MKKSSKSYPVPQHQVDATLNQANPGDGTQYEVLATTRNVRIYAIEIRCTWTVQPTPLELHVIIDGVTMTFAFTDPVSNTAYAPRFFDYRAAPADQALVGAAAETWSKAFLVEGRSVRITAEITGGTVSNLSARVKYGRW